MVIQGRRVGPPELELIRQFQAAHPDWHRTRLSRELAAAWDWRRPDGQLKDMACRSLLRKLAARGYLVLPVAAGVPHNQRRGPVRAVGHATDPVVGPLRALQPVTVAPVGAGSADAALARWLLARYHYLGFRTTVGEHLLYLARDGQGRPLGCLLFGSAAWQVRARDEFIGWSAAARRAHLGEVTNNTRFLILPWVRVPHLASHLLGRTVRRLGRDWQARHGHGLALVETFVEQTRFAGTCYRAANWQCLGPTTGRSRQDRQHTLAVPVKDVYVYVLARRFREVLA